LPIRIRELLRRNTRRAGIAQTVSISSPGPLRFAEHLATYSRVDIALDHSRTTYYDKL